MNTTNKTHIVIVGGGAGGLELAAALAKHKHIKVTLVDATLTHLWKPLLHEVAAGSLNSHDDELNYFAYAYKHRFDFEYGFMNGLDRKNKTLTLAPIMDDAATEIIATRNITYDILVLAIGSVTNDMNVPGVKQHCYFLDSLKEAEAFHQQLLKYWLAYQHDVKENNKTFEIVIVGGGATGIELAAELRQLTEQIGQYGLDKMQKGKAVEIAIIESSPRLISVLPERISAALLKELQKMKIKVYLSEFVSSVTEKGVSTKSNLFIPSDLVIWAAGIKAPDILKEFDLELNQRNQVMVKATLQTKTDEAIFAIGDCACISLDGNQCVPPRAQAAHQEAKLLAKSLSRYANGKSLLAYRYRDYGSLVSLSHNAVGNLMGKIIGTITIEGFFARLVYLSLYRKHLLTLHGFFKTTLLIITNFLNRRVKPKLKLH